MKIRFTKMSGAGNDFIFLGPEYTRLKGDLSRLAARLCPRGIAIGADGLVLVEKAAGEVIMHYFNSDGSEASFCGNGARCLVRYCAVKGIAAAPLVFRTKSGLHRGDFAGDGVKVDTDMPALVRQTTVCVDGRQWRIHLVDAGVPHAVILSDGVDRIDVEDVGSKIRRDNAFQPRGANVDFVERSAGSPFRLRTYERGVEGETLACGSGCVASALVLNLAGLAGDPVELEVASGEILTVGLGGAGDVGAEMSTGSAPAVEPPVSAGSELGSRGDSVSVGAARRPAYLAGPAVLVYEGEIEIGEL